MSSRWSPFLVAAAAAAGSSLGLLGTVFLAWRASRKMVASSTAPASKTNPGLRLVTDDDKRGSGA